MASREHLLRLLGECNLAPVQAAQATGLSESYISQLMAEESFREEVLRLRTQRLTQYSEHDTELDSLESKALSRVAETLPFMKGNDALRAFQVLNAAKRRSAQVSQSATPSMVVELEIPPAAQVHFKIQVGTSEVVEVEGRSLATLPSKNVTDMHRQITAKKLQVLEDAKLVKDAHQLPALPAAFRRLPEEDKI